MEFTWETGMLIITAMVAVTTAINQIIVGKRNSRVQEQTANVQAASTVINGYSDLCKDLTARIERNEERIRHLESELAESRAENAALQVEMAQLRQENVDLKAELTRIQERYNPEERVE